jgi:tetratricopeptide (TPR) repeat protein
MEADLEGDSTAVGTALTARIAEEERLNVRVVQALSPRDTPRVVAQEFGGQPLDLVFVDGLHVNEQLVRDVEGIRPFCGPTCIVILHDVLSWHMVQAFESLDFGPQYERRVLTRTPSGMGLVFPADVSPDVRGVIEMHCDETVNLTDLFTQLGATPERPGAKLEARLSKGWKHRRFGMANTHAREGRPDAERRELAQLAAERPYDPVAVYELGAWDAHHGRWEEAVKSLRIAEALSPKWASPPQQLGRALRELGLLSEARTCLARAVTLAPSWAAPHLELGLVASAAGDHRRAAGHFSKALELEPTWGVAQRELGLAALRAGDRPRARRVLEDLVAADGGDATTLHALALAVEGTDGLGAALGWFERASGLNPESAEVQFDLGRARTAAGNRVAAVSAYQAAVKLRPDWAEAQFDLATALVAAGDVSAAVPAYREAVRLRADWSEAHFDLGSALRRLEDHAGAALHFHQAMTLRPAWEDARIACGRAAYLSHQFALVVEALAPLAAAEQLSAELQHQLALAAESIGRIEDALNWLERAVALNPDSPEVHFDLGRVRARLGDDHGALQHFARAVRLRPSWSEARDACGAATHRLGVVARAWGGTREDGGRSPSDADATDDGARRAFFSGSAAPLAPAATQDAVAPAEQCFESGRSCVVRADFAGAMVHFRRAAELQPTWIEAWVALYETASVANDREQIVSALAALTRMLPRSTPLWYELALISALLGRGDRAQDACERGIDLELWPEPVKATAEALLSHGQAVCALGILDAALRQLPEWAGAHFARGRAFELLRQLPDAHACYARAHTLRPAWTEAADACARTASPASGAAATLPVAS